MDYKLVGCYPTSHSYLVWCSKQFKQAKLISWKLEITVTLSEEIKCVKSILMVFKIVHYIFHINIIEISHSPRLPNLKDAEELPRKQNYSYTKFMPCNNLRSQKVTNFHSHIAQQVKLSF